jgi:hypothetical protein
MRVAAAAEDEALGRTLRAGTAVLTCRLAPSDRPGAIAETSAANAAVNAVAPTITNRRVRLTRWSAASRSSWASERLRRPGP